MDSKLFWTVVLCTFAVLSSVTPWAQPIVQAPSVANATSPISADAPALVARRMVAAFAARDVNSLMNVTAEGAVLAMPYAQEGPKRLEGKAQLAAYFTAVFGRYKKITFSDLVFSPATDSKTVFVEAKAEYEAVDGARHNMGYVWVLVVERGLVVASRSYILPAGT
jgi:ketosteroid isomerase-like protein